MLGQLQKKWNVSGWRFVLILITFAIGGSLTGYLGKKIMSSFGVEQTASYLIIYVAVVTLLWPLMVLLVSIPFGQFAFFNTYLRKLGMKIWNRKSGVIKTYKVTRIAVFASGAGSNAEKIIQNSFSLSADTTSNNIGYQVALIVCNKPYAGVLQIAAKHDIPYLIIEKERFYNGDAYLPELTKAGIQFIVLAGFLWKIPQIIIDAYPRKIINIHPALLPKYGGKGMYGAYVHKAVIQSGEKKSGITIHYVDEYYDNGDIIFKKECDVAKEDTPESLAKKIHKLEHKYYPKVIQNILKSKTHKL